MAGPIAGKISKLEVKANGSYTEVKGRLDATLNLNKGEIDASHMDAGGWSNYLQGRKDATIDFSLRYLPDDAGQAILINHYFASGASEAELDIKFTCATAVTPFQAKAFVTSLTISAPDEAAQDMNGTLRINGPVGHS